MKQIDQIIKKAAIESLIEGKISYSDDLPASSEEMRDENIPGDSLQLIKMKYLDGTISKGIHDQYKNKLIGFFPADIYDRYIFTDKKVEELAKEVKELAKEEDMNYILYLKMALSEYSSHKEKFDMLIYSLYLQTRDKRLKGLAMKIYDRYRAKYLPEDENKIYYNKLFLAAETEEEYNRLYGTDPKQQEKPLNEKPSTNEESSQSSGGDNSNWILKHWGTQRTQ